MYRLKFRTQFTMAALYLILVLLIQNSLTETIIDDDDNQIESREILKTKPVVDDVEVKGNQTDSDDWMDAFIGSSNNIFPTSSATLMAQATFSDKSPEEQLEDIKEIAKQITEAIQSEMANLLADALSCTDKEKSDNELRKKRSVDTPMDSSKLVMRLLKHIKYNNDCQNIAIEKMMTAQEIADKYGINFTPDPETLSDLAVAANEQAKEMSGILKDACELKNIKESTQINSTNNFNECIKQNKDIYKNFASYNHQDPSQFNQHYNYPVESQIISPPTQEYNAPVSQRPSFYDCISYNPYEDFYPYCSMAPISTTSIIIPIEEPVNAEPELVGEEYEETVSSKVYIDHDVEPGLSTVNHVMSYTLSEKSHFRTPQIESLPEQMQYYFLL